MTEHRLKGYTLFGTPDGVEARCICGWKSGPRFTASVASALFQDHLDNPAAPEPPSLYDVVRDLCHKQGMDWTDPRTGEKFPPPKG
jgi:hypothetical protein